MATDSKDRKVVFDTPWFKVVSEKFSHWPEPHYMIESGDFVLIVATNSAGELLLVRQFRPALGMVTIELPAGHVEKNETPEQAAHKELYEETGYEADKLEFLTKLSPSARFTGYAWVFFAANIQPGTNSKFAREAGVEAGFHKGSIRSLLEEKNFVSAASWAAIFAASSRGLIKI